MVTVVGIVVAGMIMGTVDPQGAHHFEVVVIILPDAHLMVEGQGGTDQGRPSILLVVLGDCFP